MLNLQMWLQVQFKFHDCICIVVNSLCRQNRLLKSVKVNITNVNFYAFAYCDVIAEEEDRRLSFLQHEQSGKQSRAGLKSTWAEQSGKRGVLDFSGTWPEYTPWGGGSPLSGNGAENGGYRNRQEHWAATGPLMLRSHALSVTTLEWLPVLCFIEFRPNCKVFKLSMIIY